MGIKVCKKPIIKRYRPHTAVWELTLACNFKCIHCGGTAGTSRKNELTFEEIKTIAADLKRIGFPRVTLIGGEPFLRKDWYEIAQVVKDTGLELTYVTNGSLFPDDADLTAKVIEVKPSTLAFSLDGGTPETHDYIRGNYRGSFTKIMQSLELFRHTGIQLAIITTVNKLNLKELPLIRDLISGEDIVWQIQICNKNGSRFNKDFFLSKEEYIQTAEFIHNTAKQYPNFKITGADDVGYLSSKYPLSVVNSRCWDGCNAGRRTIGIQSNGDIKGCDSLPDSYVEGNIRERSLYDIWLDPKSFPYTRNFDKSQLKGCCAKCPHGEICKGGCVDIANSISGHAFENDYCLFYNENN